MFEVDPSFQTGRRKALSRHRRRRARQVLLFGILPLALILVGAGFFVDLPGLAERARLALLGGAEETMVQVASDDVAAPVVQGNAFINIAGDPTLLRFAKAGAKARVVSTSGPGVMSITRFGLPEPGRFTVFEDELVPTSRQLMIALPSSREDFALFLAQRDAAEGQMARPAVLGAADRAELEAIDTDVDLGAPDAVYGIALPAVEAAGGQVPIPDILALPQETVPDILANPAALEAAPPAEELATSVAYVRPEAARRALFEDEVILAEVEQPLAVVLAGKGVVGAEDLAPQLAAVLDGIDPLPVGAILGLRLLPEGATGKRLSVLSHYDASGFRGSVRIDPAGTISPATDPWVRDNLPSLARAGTDGAETGGAAGTNSGFRLLDAIYSAAIRDGASTKLAGELIAILSKGQELERPAQVGDRVTLAYAARPGPGGTAAGQWLFVGVKPAKGGAGFRCYVMPDPSGGFKCRVPGGTAGVSPGGGQFVTPVAGILTSKFGPRLHPILKTMRLHAGIDWAAPTGTPVLSTGAGKVKFAGVDRGYGNLLIIGHPGGYESRYGHLSRFEPGITTGALVQAGQKVAEVGSTGLSTGPHLHFELRQSGTPVDPMPLLSGAVAAAVSGSDAVESLVARIVKVESGGRADAKNPLSTATGLGQFIESTWLRMMRDYHPDFVAKMSRAELLALRTDPTLSTEMVKRLAQENEAYLRARGHQITSGRLYLAHFLGPEGASRVLSAGDSDMIAVVMGAGVVSANPFLRNYTVADLKAWAARKMDGPGATIIAAPVVEDPPEVKAFIALADQVVGALGPEPARRAN
ncbi:peptidase M23-like protein [Rhodobacter sp. JA431]|uniref:peptidoglycan DD-metalloendopeptidase family protein n=1 Tax=Rhodobacter sp. JA431 TaxID=570013 RepID=UPI000BD6F78F|nr:peptidoglycan DD-metalloendopeptidase family protein [Rhodobacter sp. JA431]SOC10534.1 peptidase M23-like protein [Rhodobacter sp. JA431]